MAAPASPSSHLSKEAIINEAHKQALADGRRAAAAKRREQRLTDAAFRVQEFQRWLRADAEWHAAGMNGPRPVIPVVPSDDDYAYFTGEETTDAA